MAPETSLAAVVLAVLCLLGAWIVARPVIALAWLRRGVFDAVGEGICLTDARHRLVLWNEMFRSLLGYADDALVVGAPCPGLSFPAAIDRLEQMPGDGTTIQLIRPDGRIIGGSRLPGPGGGWVLSFRDITDRIVAARSMAESPRSRGSHERRARAHARRLSPPRARVTPERGAPLESATDRQARLLGNGPSRTTGSTGRPKLCASSAIPRTWPSGTGHPCASASRPRIAPAVEATDHKPHAGAGDRAQLSIALPDGTIRVIHESVETVFDERQRAIGRIGVVQDNQRARAAAARFGESEVRLRSFMQHAPSAWS